MFLRAQVDASGKTLTVLAGEVHLSKSRISEHLAGRVPDRGFVAALIHATVPEPRLRERLLAEAGKLLREAAHPSPVTPPAPAVSALELAEARALQVEIYDRLTHSLEQQNQLRDAAESSMKLVMVLLTMIDRLQLRITDLTDERDQLRATYADPDTLRQTQEQLTRSLEQERRARQELQSAQEKQCQAEELAARVQTQIGQLTDELDRLRAGSASDIPVVGYGSSPDRGLAQPAEPADPVGDDIDEALDRVTAVNNQDDQTLRRIMYDLVQNPTADEAVRDNSPGYPSSDSVQLQVILDALTALPSLQEPGVLQDYARQVGRALGITIFLPKTNRWRDSLRSLLHAVIDHPHGLQVLGNVMELREGNTRPVARLKTAIALTDVSLVPASAWQSLMPLLDDLDVPDIAEVFDTALGDRALPLPAHCREPWLAVLYAATLNARPGEPGPFVLLVEGLAQHARRQQQQELLNWAAEYRLMFRRAQ